MKLAELLIGFGAGYFAFTESGRKSAKEGITQGTKYAIGYAKYYADQFLPKLPEDKEITDDNEND